MILTLIFPDTTSCNPFIFGNISLSLYFRLMNDEVRANLAEANQVVLNCPDGVDLDPIHSFLSHAQLTISEYHIALISF